VLSTDLRDQHSADDAAPLRITLVVVYNGHASGRIDANNAHNGQAGDREDQTPSCVAVDKMRNMWR